MHQELRHYHVVFQFTLLGASQHGIVPVLLTFHFQVCLLSLVLPYCPSSLLGITLHFTLLLLAGISFPEVIHCTWSETLPFFLQSCIFWPCFYPVSATHNLLCLIIKLEFSSSLSPPPKKKEAFRSAVQFGWTSWRQWLMCFLTTM